MALKTVSASPETILATLTNLQPKDGMAPKTVSASPETILAAGNHTGNSYQPSAQGGKAPKTVSASPETVLAIPHQSAALGWNGAENRISVAGNHTGNSYQPSTQGWNGAENRISVAGNHTGSRKPYWHPAAFSPVVDQAQASYTWIRLHRFEGGSRHSYAGVCESQHLQGVLHSAWIYILS
jgi:hypothetical protein